jgi:hypothetical protein
MLALGQTIQNRYTIQSTLGQGGFGQVYGVYDHRLNRQVALKGTFETSPDAIRQFETEAKLLARLRHPNLPTVSDHFVEANQHYLVMDFIPGEDLGVRLVREGRLSEPAALAIMLPVFDALAYLHSQQPQPVIHRDIKPGNIRITPSHQVFLVDFGLAKTHDAHGKTTAAARAVTPGFSPLEQYGLGTTDARSDLYAAGATLYALLTGYQPPEALARAVADTLVPLRQVLPNASPQLEMIVSRLLAMNPAYRSPDAQTVITDLLAVHSTRLCSRCGAQNRAAGKFCNACGAALVTAASQASQTPYAGPTISVPAPAPPFGMQVFKPGASTRYDTIQESPARAVLDGATLVVACAWLLPWARFQGHQWSGFNLAHSPFGYQYEVIIAVFALTALGGLLFVRKQVAATRTALARWKLLLGVTALAPALDIAFCR